MFVAQFHNGSERYMTPAVVLYDANTHSVQIVFEDDQAMTFNDGIIKVYDHGVEVRKFDLRQSWWKRTFG